MAGVVAIIALIAVALTVVLVTIPHQGVASQVAKAARHGHDANDSRCSYWMGDFAGVDLRARCPICSPEKEEL